MKHAGAMMGLMIALIIPVQADAKAFDLQASSKWAMDYEPDGCRLVRNFGTGDELINVQIRRFEPGADFDLHLIGRLLTVGSPTTSAMINFDGGATPLRVPARSGIAGNLPALFLHGTLGRMVPTEPQKPGQRHHATFEEDPETEAKVRMLEIDFGRKAIKLQIGDMSAPMTAMRKCTTDLVRSWGLDPDKQKYLSRPVPANDATHWLKSEDYPKVAILRGQQAVVRYRLLVDADGIPTTCNVQLEIGNDFGQLSCALLMTRARFQPARDNMGNAAASYFVGSANWIIR